MNSFPNSVLLWLLVFLQENFLGASIVLRGKPFSLLLYGEAWLGKRYLFLPVWDIYAECHYQALSRGSL